MNEEHYNEIRVLAKNQEELVNYLQRFSLFGHMFDGNVGVTLANTHTVKGTATLSADGVFGRAVATGQLRFKWVELSEESVTMYAIRLDQSDNDFKNDITKTLTLESCIRRGVARAATWKQYPEQMLMSKVKTFVARALFPDVVGGIYGVEELSEDDVQVLKALDIEDVQPQKPSNPPPIPKQLPSPKPKFDPTKSLTSDDLISQLSQAGFNGTLIMNNSQVLGNILNLLDNDEDKIKIGRLCFESPRHLGLVAHMGVNVRNLGLMDYWHDNQGSKLLKTPFELASFNNFNESPWEYYRPFLS